MLSLYSIRHSQGGGNLKKHKEDFIAASTVNTKSLMRRLSLVRIGNKTTRMLINTTEKMKNRAVSENYTVDRV